MTSEGNLDICESKPPPTDAELQLLLRQVGFRVTATRMAVLRQLLIAPSPLTHAQLLPLLPNLATDKSTVFRALQDFVDRGLVRRTDVGDRVWRYEASCKWQSMHVKLSHPHLLCIHCGSVTCLLADDVELSVAESLGAVEEILFRGTCYNCLDDSMAR